MTTCTFDGNSDMYGLGIRIGFYLQWYGGILASWLAKSEVPGMRLANGLFVAATFLALIIQIGESTSNLRIVEIYIILLLTFGAYLFLVPIYFWRIVTRFNHIYDPSRYPRVPTSFMFSVLYFILIFAVSSFQLWFWFDRVPQLSTQACQEFGFFFSKIRLNQNAFQAVNIVFHFFLLLSCFINLVSLARVQLKLVEEEPRKQRSRRQRQIDRIRGKSLQQIFSVCNLIVAGTVTAATELTIQWNQITNINKVSSAGQTIPLIIGIGSVVRVCYVYFVNLNKDTNDNGNGHGHRETSPSPEPQPGYHIPPPVPQPGYHIPPPQRRPAPESSRASPDIDPAHLHQAPPIFYDE